MTKLLPRFPQWISPRISLPVANLGKIPGKIALRFLPPWICSSVRILARFAVAFWWDFGYQDYCFSARILVRFAAGSRRDFGRRDFFFSARILARFAAGSRRDFGRREFHFPARILPGSRRDSRREEKSRRPKSRQDPDAIPAEIAAGSRQDPGSYFTRVKARQLLMGSNLLIKEQLIKCFQHLFTKFQSNLVKHYYPQWSRKNTCQSNLRDTR